MRTPRSRLLKEGGTAPAVGAGKSCLCPRPCTATIGCDGRTRLAYWLDATSVRIGRRRHGSLQEQVRQKAPPRVRVRPVLPR